MRLFIGIDLGSTTTKAVVIDEARNVLGRGITNSRSNYDTAAAVAKQEALVNARFHLFRHALGAAGALNGGLDAFIGQLERDFRAEQYLEQLGDLEATCLRSAETGRLSAGATAVRAALEEVFRRLRLEAPALFAPGAKRKSDFFRDIAGSQYLAVGETVAKENGLPYDNLLNVFDRSIIEVENRVYGESISTHLLAALERTKKFSTARMPLSLRRMIVRRLSVLSSTRTIRSCPCNVSMRRNAVVCGTPEAAPRLVTVTSAPASEAS